MKFKIPFEVVFMTVLTLLDIVVPLVLGLNQFIWIGLLGVVVGVFGILSYSTDDRKLDVAYACGLVFTLSHIAVFAIWANRLFP